MKTGAEAPVEDRVVYRAEMMRALDCCSRTLTRYVRDEKLPAPDVRLTLQKQGWRISTLRAHGVNLF
jgi:hypothetical protein